MTSEVEPYHGFTGKQVQRGHMELAKRRKVWIRPQLPMDRGAMRVTEVLAAEPRPCSGREDQRLVRGRLGGLCAVPSRNRGVGASRVGCRVTQRQLAS